MELTGTEKQIAWAEKIAAPVVAKYPELAAITSAKFWIENRELPAYAILFYFRKKQGQECSKFHEWEYESKTTQDNVVIKTETVKHRDRYGIFGFTKKIPLSVFVELHIGYSADLETLRTGSLEKLEKENLIVRRVASSAPNGAYSKATPAALVVRVRQGGDLKVYPIYD